MLRWVSMFMFVSETCATTCFPAPLKTKPASNATQLRWERLDGTSLSLLLYSAALLPEVKNVLALTASKRAKRSLLRSIATGLRDSRRAAGTPACNLLHGQRCCHSALIRVPTDTSLETTPPWAAELPVWNVGLKNGTVATVQSICQRTPVQVVLIDGVGNDDVAAVVRDTCKPLLLIVRGLDLVENREARGQGSAKPEAAAHFTGFARALQQGASERMRPACEMIGCAPESSFAPDPAGWVAYWRVHGVEAARPTKRHLRTHFHRTVLRLHKAHRPPVSRAAARAREQQLGAGGGANASRPGPGRARHKRFGGNATRQAHRGRGRMAALPGRSKARGARRNAEETASFSYLLSVAFVGGVLVVCVLAMYSLFCNVGDACMD